MMCGCGLIEIVIVTGKVIPFVVSLSNHERAHSASNLPFDKPVLSLVEGLRANGG